MLGWIVSLDADQERLLTSLLSLCDRPGGMDAYIGRDGGSEAKEPSSRAVPGATDGALGAVGLLRRVEHVRLVNSPRPPPAFWSPKPPLATQALIR